MCVYMRGRERGGGSVSVARALVVVARRLPFEEEKRKVVVVEEEEEGRRKRAREGGRTSGPTPLSESDIQAVAQRCATRVCFRFDDVWAHVEVRKGKERSR